MPAPWSLTLSLSAFPTWVRSTRIGAGRPALASAALRIRLTSRSYSALGSPFKYTTSSVESNSRGIFFSLSTRLSRVQQERTTRTASNRSDRARAPRARSLTARRKLAERSISSTTWPSSSSSSSRRPAATSVQRPSDSIARCRPARAAVRGFDSSCAMIPGSVVMSFSGSDRAAGGWPGVGSRRSSSPRHSPASSRVSRSRLRRSRPSGGGAGGRVRTGATTQSPSPAPRHPTQRLPCTIVMFHRRRVASTSSLVAWWVGAGSLEAWGSSSARADTSQTVTGRPPRATLAWRRISRRPSTNVSGCVTEAPARTLTRPGGHTSRRSRWASVGTRGRALHMRQTAQTVKLRRHVVLPRAAAWLIVPGMDVRPRRKEQHVSPPEASPTPRVGRAPRGPIEGRRDREHIRTLVVPDHDDLALRLADRIVEIIARETAAKGRRVLGLATGSTPLGIYRELIRRHQAGEGDFSRVVTFNLDEYYPMPPDSPHSYRRYMWENLFAHVNIRPEQVHIPDSGVPRETLAEHCAAYERANVEAGGIDFQMLGIGKSGHIGFNEPGSSPDERTRLVTLDTVTRKDASADFFGEDNVPREAITMGVASILEAREIALIATGEHKADIVARAVGGEVSQDVAATFLQRHANATAYLDLAAAAELTRIKTPL